MLSLCQTELLVVPARITEIRGLGSFLHPPDERRPHAWVAAETAGDEAVARPEVLVRDVGMATAAPAWNDAGVDERDRAVLERGCDRFLDRDLDVLTASGPSPRAERRQRADSGVRAREVIRLLARRRERRAVRVSAERHHPAHGGRGEIGAAPLAARSALSERGDRDADQRGMAHTQIGPGQTQGGESSRWQRFDDDVRGGDERSQTVARLRIVEIDRDRACARSEMREPERVATQRTAARRLDHDDLGPEPDHQPSEEGAGDVREIDDADHADVSPRPRYAWRIRRSTASVLLGPCTTMRPVSST